MSAYKQFTTKDIVITPFSANKGFRYRGPAMTASNVGIEIYYGTQPPDSTTFEIDYLVQIPFESIQGEQAPIITGSILNSNNENLIPVASTFVPNRKLKAYYNNATKQFRNFKFFQTPTLSTTTSPILNYGAEKPESKYILLPAQEIVSEFTNQKSDITVSLTSSCLVVILLHQ